MNYFFSLPGRLLGASLLFLFSIASALSQTQDFEGSFTIVSYPQPFLPGWYANDLRSTASRVFRLPAGGVNGSAALAIQPISTFTGRIWVRLQPKGMGNPRVVFWAKTLKNGTGTRPALVYASWASTLAGNYQDRMPVGDVNQFPNQTTSFSKIELEVPAQFSGREEVFLSLEVGIGAGTGSAARWVMDAFGLEDRVVDEVAPQVEQVKGFGSKEVLVVFSEPVDPVFSQLPLGYALEGKAPLEVRRLADSVVVLAFEEELVEEKEYPLFLQQVADLQGNFMADTLIKFRYTDPQSFGLKSLVINEVMAAPRQDQDLPFVEYVELMNPLEKELRLEGLIFSTSTSQVVLPPYWIAPGEMVLLCPSLQAGLLRPFGKVLAIENWPVLPNSGTTLRVREHLGQLIDQLSYLTSSWGGTEFANGGYSLELPDPLYRCEGTSLLGPSRDPRRGTPGTQNSNYERQEATGPLQAEASWFTNSKTITISLNQAILPKIGIAAFVFTPELATDSSWVFASGKRIGISLAAPAKGSLPYRMKATALEPCIGVSGGFETSLILGEEPASGELVLNELLVDPRPGDPKFVEIHNTSSQKYLSLNGWALAMREGEGAPQQVQIFGEEGQILPAKGFLALSIDPDRLRLTYPQSATGDMMRVKGLPSLPLKGGTLLLLSPGGEVFESLSYREAWHHPLLRTTKGVSLERIAPLIAMTDQGNWHSASSASGYGTPGRKNSIVVDTLGEEQLLLIDPQVFDPDGSSGPNFVTVRYSLEQAGWVGSFTVYSAAGREVAVLGQQQILGTSGMYSWSGTDGGGRRVRPGYYVLVAQLFDLNGRIKVIKKAFVVASAL
ncbi:MAG: lamin tail domain-containing protein [Algoriphagus sp.]|nr:lamin tail domain-containing protein [Algoriphagus sp.]